MYIFVMGFVNCIVGCWLWYIHLIRLWLRKFKKESVSLCYLLWHFKAILSETKLLSHSTNIHWARTVYQAPCWVLELQYKEDRHFADFTVVEGHLRRFNWFFLTKKQCCSMLTEYFVTKVVVVIIQNHLKEITWKLVTVPEEIVRSWEQMHSDEQV